MATTKLDAPKEFRKDRKRNLKRIKNCKVTLLVTILITLLSACIQQPPEEGVLQPEEEYMHYEEGVKGGPLLNDETWEGEILVSETVIVPEGVTLTIEPGTFVKFRHYRGYKEPKVGLVVEGGTIKAVGTPEEQIWFTSDAENPINGDWSGISLINTRTSTFDYVIVEYGEIGIEQFYSAVNVTNSVVRWNNSEGLYSETSTPLFKNNTIYGNAYHAIALENFNEYVQILDNVIYGPSYQGIMVQNTNVLIEGNYFVDFVISEAVPEKVIWVVMSSHAVVRSNKFEVTGEGDPIYVEDSSLESEDNDYGDGHISKPEFDYDDVKITELGYIIGDLEDQYLYVYDEVDETRRVISRHGEGLGLGWTLTYAKGGIWRFTAGGAFVKIDPVTGVDWGNEYANPEHLTFRGLTFDGEYFWGNEHSLLKIVKFRLGTTGGYYDVGSQSAIEVVDSFDLPDKEFGGGSGIATDGEYLYVPSAADGTKLYKLDKTGNIVDEIYFEGFIGPSITWTGDHFWTGGGSMIVKWTKEGNPVGAIYAPAVETWDITWDGQYLWTMNRTCENWDDAKVFQIEVLNENYIGAEKEHTEHESHTEILEGTEFFITIDAGQLLEPISTYVYGQFIEHQGRCIYGGIWAEMLEDRKFYYPVNYYFPWGENKYQSPWKPVGFDTVVVMSGENSYVGEHTPEIFLDGKKPRGIMQDGLALQNGKEYTGRIVLAGEGSKETEIETEIEVDVSLVWGPGVNDKNTVTLKITNQYTTYPLQFTAGADTDYGQLEITGKGQGTFSIGCVSLMPADNIHGMRADTIQLLKELNATVYRWPGGIFVNDYDWLQAVGDRDKRPPRENRAYWSVDIESNDFGLDEFMRFCHVLDAEPYVVVSSTGEADAAMAAAEVEYLNGAPDTPMGRLRAANGHPEPYNVTFFGVGNEMWGFAPLNSYSERHNQITEAMLKVDPYITIIAVGGFEMEGLRPGESWTEGMFNHCADFMDLISEHMYGGSSPILVEHAQSISEGIRHIVRIHRELRERLPSLKGKDIRIALDEWNYFWGDRKEIYGEAGPRYFLKDALGMAAGLHEMFRNSDLIFMANTHPVNVHGQVKTTKTDAALEVTGLVLQLYRNHFGTLPVVVTGDTHPLDVVAALTSDGKTLTVAIVNPTEYEHTLKVALKNAHLTGTGQLWIIAHSDPSAYNEPGTPPKIIIREQVVSGISNELIIPPLSIIIYELPIQ